MNMPKVGDIVRQISGPCRGQLFKVHEVEGRLIRVKLVNPPEGSNPDPEWSHHLDYLAVNTDSK